MMSKILSPMVPASTEERLPSALQPTQEAAGQSDEVVRRIRQDYLRSLGILRTKAVPQGGRNALAAVPAGPPAAVALGTPTTDEEISMQSSIVEEDCSAASTAEGSSCGTASEAESRSGSFEGLGGPGPLERGSQDAFRMNFLKKLSYSRVWVPPAQRPPKSQTVIIFDWDDTLLCTSYLSHFTNRPMPPAAEAIVAEISRAARSLLELALRLGQTFIITNAMCGWVEYSAAKWAPELLPVLERVHTISARSRYESFYPEVHQWKIQAFLEVRRQLDSQVVTNLLSVGDSDFEMDAVHIMGSEFTQALVKTVKFREGPVPEDLLKELLLVASKFERIVEAGRNLKVCLDRRPPVNTHEG